MYVLSKIRNEYFRDGHATQFSQVYTIQNYTCKETLLWHDYWTLKYETHCKKLTCTCMNLGWKSSLFILMHGWDFIKNNQEFVKNNRINLGVNWTPPTEFFFILPKNAPCLSKVDSVKQFHRTVFELLAPKAVIKGVFNRIMWFYQHGW